MTVDLVEYTDPGCSWAWGTEPKLRLLRWRYGDRIRWRRVMGGLVGDFRNYGPQIADAATMIGYWRKVSQTTGMPYPARLRYHYGSTEPACLAVKAAEMQGPDVASRVLRRLREATFVYGHPPDTDERILDALHGLDARRIVDDMHGDEARSAFRADWEETREPNELVRSLEPGPPGGARFTEGHWRYVFPTVIVDGTTVPGWRPYETYEQAVREAGVTGPPRPRPTPAEAFETWPTLTPKELETICGTTEPPDGTVAYDWGDGVIHMTAAEAACVPRRARRAAAPASVGPPRDPEGPSARA